jgi:hypothetical protein
MRVRNAALIGAIFVAAALSAWFVVRQLPGEGQVSPAPSTAAAPSGAAPTAVAPAPPARTPPLERAPTAADGLAEIRVTAGGEPVAGAEVRLWLVRSDVAPGDVPFRDAGHAATGADGIARLPAAPGAYLAAARASGLAPAHAELIRAPGEPATHSEIALAPPVALEGRAVSRDGARGLPARIAVIPEAGLGGAFGAPLAPPEERAAVAADASGVFRVEGLAPGTYAVSVEADGHHPVLLARVALPRPEPLVVSLDALGTAEGTVQRPDGRAAAGARVHLAGEEHDGVAVAGPDGRFAVQLPAGSYLVLATDGGLAGALGSPVAIRTGATAGGLAVRLGAAATVEGAVVVAKGERPIAGAEVALFPHRTRALGARALAGADGRFRIAGLAPGAYDLRAAAPGRSPAFLPGVTVAAGQRFSVEVPLAGTGAIEGVVRNDAGAPLASARVRVVLRGDGLSGAAPLEARTDFDGRYRIDGLEIGRAELVAHQEGVALGVARAIRVAEGRAGRADFFLPEAGFLVGGVGPAKGPCSVIATPMKAGLGTAQSARTLADGNGHFRLAVPAGEYRVHAAPADAVRTDLRVTPAFATVQAGRTTRLELAPAAPSDASGLDILVLEPGGAPSPGAVVTIARAGDDRVALATTAGEDGRVTLDAAIGLAGRPVSLRARNGGRTGGWTGTLEPGETATVGLSPGGAVEGTVRATGRRVDGFTLEVAAQPVPGAWRTLDLHRFAGDRFELGDLPPEAVRLTVRTGDGRRGEADLLPVAGETRTVEIELAGRGVAGATPGGRTQPR